MQKKQYLQAGFHFKTKPALLEAPAWLPAARAPAWLPAARAPAWLPAARASFAVYIPSYRR